MVEYVGYHISAKGITRSLDKVKAVSEKPIPRNIKSVQAFLGFANFNRRFIEDFSQICRPRTDNLRKSMKFEWTPACQESFKLLKGRFSSTHILAHFNPDAPTEVETDASNFAKSGVLSELHSSYNK